MIYHIPIILLALLSSMLLRLFYICCICVVEIPLDRVLLPIFFQLHIQWHLIGGPKLSTVTVFIPEKWADTRSQGFYLRVPVVIHLLTQRPLRARAGEVGEWAGIAHMSLPYHYHANPLHHPSLTSILGQKLKSHAVMRDGKWTDIKCRLWNLHPSAWDFYFVLAWPGQPTYPLYLCNGDNHTSPVKLLWLWTAQNINK